MRQRVGFWPSPEAARLYSNVRGHYVCRERRVQPIRILVVEDEPQVAEIIREALRRVGHESLLAGDVAEADRLLSSVAVDGITLDLRLPGRDGLEWLGGLFEHRPELARRTIVVTGAELRPEECHDLARCGASMLAKPFRLDELLDTIGKQLSPLHSPSRN